MLWRCWLGGRKGIRPVKNWVVGAGVVVCLEQGADLHMAQLMPLPLTVFCFSKIQTGYTFLVPVQEKRPLNGCVCVCVCPGICNSDPQAFWNLGSVPGGRHCEKRIKSHSQHTHWTSVWTVPLEYGCPEQISDLVRCSDCSQSLQSRSWRRRAGLCAWSASAWCNWVDLFRSVRVLWTSLDVFVVA